MARKHKAFGVVRREIAKKIREHKRNRKKVTGGKRKKLDLAIRELTYLSADLRSAYTSGTRVCPF